MRVAAAEVPSNRIGDSGERAGPARRQSRHGLGVGPKGVLTRIPTSPIQDCAVVRDDDVSPPRSSTRLDHEGVEPWILTGLKEGSRQDVTRSGCEEFFVRSRPRGIQICLLLRRAKDNAEQSAQRTAVQLRPHQETRR
jgi:hypothetical protein